MAITVQDLIDELSGMDPTLEVHFSYNYGDHWRTQVAPAVRSVDVGMVAWSDYHNMHKVDEPDWDDEDDVDADKLKSVVLIG